MYHWLLTAPLWFVFLVLCASLLASMLAGAHIGPLIAAAGKKETSDQEGYVVSAVMGLLALLIGFTFALAIDRYDDRRVRVLDEANAIGTVYLRAQLLDQPHRANVSRLLLDYTDNRLALVSSPPEQKEIALQARNDRLISQLWSETMATFPTIKGYDFSGSFLDSMNQVIDLDTTRQEARSSRVPPPVYGLLFVYLFVAAGVLGYTMGGTRGRASVMMLLFLFSLSVILVVDIDRPNTGMVQESQEPMLRLQAWLHAQQAAVPAPAEAPQAK